MFHKLVVIQGLADWDVFTGGRWYQLASELKPSFPLFPTVDCGKETSCLEKSLQVYSDPGGVPPGERPLLVFYHTKSKLATVTHSPLPRLPPSPHWLVYPSGLLPYHTLSHPTETPKHADIPTWFFWP